MNIMKRVSLKMIPACCCAAALFLISPAVASTGESLSYSGQLPPARSSPLVWSKDPFIPAVKRLKAIDLKLTAVFYGTDAPSAIINDRIVYRGGVVNGQKVIDIGRTHVILQGDAGAVRLEIPGVTEPGYGSK